MCKIVVYEDAERQVVAKRFRTPLAEKGKIGPNSPKKSAARTSSL